MTPDTALRSMSAHPDAHQLDECVEEELKATPLGQAMADILERRGALLDRLLVKEVVDKKQQNVTIAEPCGLSAKYNEYSLRDQIEEIKAFASQLDENVSTDKSRELLYCIYTRAAKAVGRNSPDAIRADISARLESLVRNSAVPLFSGRSGDTPERYVERELIPKLDPDMRAYAFEQNIFREPMKRFYSTIKAWRFERRVGVDKFKLRLR